MASPVWFLDFYSPVLSIYVLGRDCCNKSVLDMEIMNQINGFSNLFWYFGSSLSEPTFSPMVVLTIGYE